MEFIKANKTDWTDAIKYRKPFTLLYLFGW